MRNETLWAVLAGSTAAAAAVVTVFSASLARLDAPLPPADALGGIAATTEDIGLAAAPAPVGETVDAAPVPTTASMDGPRTELAPAVPDVEQGPRLRVAGRRALVEFTQPIWNDYPFELVAARHDRDAADALINGRADAAILGSPVSANERGRGLHGECIAWFAPVLVVPRGHRVHGLGPDVARDLLRGRLDSWLDAGGPAEPVVLLGPENGAQADLLAELMVPGDRLQVAERHRSFAHVSAALGSADPRTHVAVLPWTRVPSGARALALGQVRPRRSDIVAGGWDWAIPVHVAVGRGNEELLRWMLDRTREPEIGGVLEKDLILVDVPHASPR